MGKKSLSGFNLTNDLAFPEVCEKNSPGQDVNVVDHSRKAFIADYYGFSRGMLIHKGFEGCQISLVYQTGSFDFYSDFSCPQDEVDFKPGFGSPEVHIKIDLAVAVVGCYFHEYKMLQGLAEKFPFFCLNRPFCYCISYTHIEQVKLGSLCNHLPILTLFERRNPPAKQGVHKNLVVFFYCL